MIEQRREIAREDVKRIGIRRTWRCPAVASRIPQNRAVSGKRPHNIPDVREFTAKAVTERNGGPLTRHFVVEQDAFMFNCRHEDSASDVFLMRGGKW
jgi:hypothetical protein